MGKATFIEANGDLYSGTSIQLSEEDLATARAFVDRDLSLIKADFLEQLERLGPFIKENFGAIPRADDFANAFFDSLSIRYTGSNLPNITDHQILEFAQAYLAKLKKMVHEQKVTAPLSGSLRSFEWLKSNSLLESLRLSLNYKYLAPESSAEAFYEAFSAKKLKEIKAPVIWHRLGKNNLLNKRSIYDLLFLLSDHKFITDIRKYPNVELQKIMGFCFSEVEGKLKFSNANMKLSQDYNDLKEIVESLNT